MRKVSKRLFPTSSACKKPSKTSLSISRPVLKCSDLAMNMWSFCRFFHCTNVWYRLSEMGQQYLSFFYENTEESNLRGWCRMNPPELDVPYSLVIKSFEILFFLIDKLFRYTCWYHIVPSTFDVIESKYQFQCFSASWKMSLQINFLTVDTIATILDKIFPTN